jgi:hypothetical protein
MPTPSKVNYRVKDVIDAFLVDQPVAYHPLISRAVGSVTAGVLLSQFLYWTPRVQDEDGWFYKTQRDIYEETALTRPEQETARKKLKTLGVLEEKNRGVPAKLYFRVIMPTLKALLTELVRGRAAAEESEKGVPKRRRVLAQPGSGNPATQDAGIQQPRMRQARMQARGNPANQSAAIPLTITEITSETTAEITNRDYSPSNSKGAAPEFLDDKQERQSGEADDAALVGDPAGSRRNGSAHARGVESVRQVLAEKGLASSAPAAPEPSAPVAAKGFARAGTVLNNTPDEPLSDEDLDRLRAELAEVADDLGDTAPAQSTLTRVVGYYRSVDLDLDGFTRCLHVAHSRTKEDLQTGRVRDTSKAFAYFLSLLKQESELRARQGVGKRRRSLAGKYARYVRR